MTANQGRGIEIIVSALGTIVNQFRNPGSASVPESKQTINIIGMTAPILVAATAIELLSRWVGDWAMSEFFASIRIIFVTAAISYALLRCNDWLPRQANPGD